MGDWRETNRAVDACDLRAFADALVVALRRTIAGNASDIKEEGR